jgi:xanthine/CO dehydrogenase XdhC/CoxF family maturation factor
VVAALHASLAEGAAVVLVTAVETRGTPPCRTGQKLLLGTGGALAGTLGCSELDAAAANHAGVALDSGADGLFWLPHPDGDVHVYVEPFVTPACLVVLSATPVAAHLVRWAGELGWETVLVEPDPGRVTDAVRASAGSVVAALPPRQLGARDAIVATDHDAPSLADLLSRGLDSGAGYVGLMGSRRHVAAHLAALEASGLDDDALARLETPVGLDLGGQSAPEIALAILAGLVAWRHGRAGGRLAGQARTRP